jgi:predicted amidohydrolase
MIRGRAIAVAQTCPQKGDVPTNIHEHIQLVELAAAYGVKIGVFPELSLTGYELALCEELAFSVTDPRLSPLLVAAEAHDTTLVVGAPVRLNSFLHIGALILYPSGAVDVYTKHRLGAFSVSAKCDSCDGQSIPPAEATVFAAGNHIPLIQSGDTIAAVAVCADIGDQGHPQRAAEQGANTYLASMFVIPSDFDGEEAKLKRYALQHGMMTALANFGCSSGGLRSAGKSSIWSEAGRLLVQLPDAGSGVAVVSESPYGRSIAMKMLEE